jgi:DNA-binding NarL/FixJ family response regulator
MRSAATGMERGREESVRILLVDDHVVVRAGLRMLVESQVGLRVVGEAGCAAEALAVAASEQPDIVLLDLALGGEDGLELLPRLLAAASSSRVLVLTATKDVDVHSQALRLGAMGLVQKDASAEILLKAIRKVSAGEPWFDRALLGRALPDLTGTRRPEDVDPETARIATLTKRELEVVRLVGEGLRNRAIGERLFISETTARHHLTSIYGKLGVADRFELMVFAYRHGLSGRKE